METRPYTLKCYADGPDYSNKYFCFLVAGPAEAYRVLVDLASSGRIRAVFSQFNPTRASVRIPPGLVEAVLNFSEFSSSKAWISYFPPC